jgi:hypothetical protein
VLLAVAMRELIEAAVNEFDAKTTEIRFRAEQDLARKVFDQAPNEGLLVPLTRNLSGNSVDLGEKFWIREAIGLMSNDTATSEAPADLRIVVRWTARPARRKFFGTSLTKPPNPVQP